MDERRGEIFFLFSKKTRSFDEMMIDTATNECTRGVLRGGGCKVKRGTRKDRCM